MSTLSKLSLQVAQATMKVVEGQATAGTTTTLTDGTLLTQPSGTFDGGLLWILSGTYADEIRKVTSFISNKLTWDTALGGNVAAGTRYAVAGPDVPFEVIRRAINDALLEFLYEQEDTSLTGDGETLAFTLPATVFNITKITTHDPSDATKRNVNTHWHEQDGILRFDNGHPPQTSHVIHVFYRVPHDELVDGDDVIADSVNLTWLKWTAAINLLHWMYREYRDDIRYGIPTLLERAMNNQKMHKKYSRPFVTVHTA